MKHPLFLWLCTAISSAGVAQEKVTDSLMPKKKLLDEVVISGYSTATRRQYTGAVSIVSAEKINHVPMASFDQSLQGRVPGLYVASGSGQPGAAARVLIRGQATISGTVSPLYVVDGMAVESGVFMSMNPADFESVSVLKDANATALYGSRGANGVILITTKRGRAGKVIFTLQTQHGFSQAARSNFNMMNTQERLQFEEEIGLESGRNIGPGWSLSPRNPANASLSIEQQQHNAALLDSLRGIDTDWRDHFTRRSAPFHEYELSAAGGNEMVRFYSSVNYLQQQGIALRSGIERYSFRNNMDVHSDRFTAAINTAVGYTKNDLIENENKAGLANPFSAMYFALPYEQPYVNGQLVHSGNKAKYGAFYDTRLGADGIERMQSTSYRVNQLKAIINSSLRYDLTDHLYASMNIGFDFRQNNEIRTVKPGTYSGSLTTIPGRQGSYREEIAQYYQFTAAPGLTYTHTVNSLHDFTLAGFYEFNRLKSSTLNLTGYGITSGLAGTISGVTQGSAFNGFIPVIGGGRTGMALASWVALGRYTYADKYMLNLTFRRDGSSSVPKKNRWHNFYSVGAGYDIGKEAFLEAQDWLDVLRVRTSYGTAASPFSRNFAYAAGYGTARYDGAPAIVPTEIGNEDYDWEYTRMFNAGLDVTLMDQRIRLIADWYDRHTHNVFVDEQISQTSGFSTRKVNAGKVRNRGVELDLSGDIIRTKTLLWSAGFNIAINRNRVMTMGGANEFTQGASITKEGLPIRSHYIVKWAGVDPETGRGLYYGRDGLVTTTNDPVTQSVAAFGGYNTPYAGGFSSQLKWKEFSVSLLFTYIKDLYRYNTEEVYVLSNNNASYNQSRKWLNRWKQPGDIAPIQKFSYSAGFTSRDIQDASFVRLRNAQIAYTLPVKPKFMRSAMVYVQGQNLITWTKWTGADPEDNDGSAEFEYPAARTITAGLSVQF